MVFDGYDTTVVVQSVVRLQESGTMSDELLTRRRAFGVAAGLFSATVLGCRGKSGPNPPGEEQPLEEMPMATDPAPTLGWETIASGKYGLGVRSRHGLVYDRNAKVAVMFGGVIWTPKWNLQNDTWELHGRRWFRIKTAEAPPARHRGAMVYMDNRGQTVLFGGQGQTNDILGDTWTYANRSWQRVKSGSGTPPPRCGHCMAFDEQAGVAVLFGGIDRRMNSLGDTWVFDGSSWKEVRGSAPPARRYAALAYDLDLKGCLLHGGSEDESGRRSFGDAWLFQNNAWRPMARSFDTDARDDHGLAYHQGAKRMVMLEGVAGKRGMLVRDADGWQAVQANPLHARHQCSPLAWDADLGGLILHGGEQHHEGPQFDATLLLRMPLAV
jgi:Galactose oxidase, central domain